MKNFLDKQVWFFGILHALVSFTAIAVVTKILGFSVPLAFLFAGVGTLVFHIVTKNVLPSVLGVSGLYIGSIMFVTQHYGKAYAFGGVVVAGLVYVIFAVLMYKWQEQVMKYFPNWLLSMVILLVTLNLIPIGVDIVKESMLIGLSALVTTAFVDLLGGKRFKVFAMPTGVIVGTIVAYLTTGLDFSVFSQEVKIEYIAPQFNWQASLTIGLIAIAVLFEMMGDIKNIGSIINRDVFKEVGLWRISLGNGIATIFGGLGGANAYTTYAENNGFVLQTKYYNPNAQIITAFFFILMAFIPQISQLIMLVPLPVFGGVVLYLFCLIGVNAINNIMQSDINLKEDSHVLTIMTTMLAISSLSYVIGGVSISSVAIATIVGVILNFIHRK
jgi:uracil permease